jgi:hypothetical protein
MPPAITEFFKLLPRLAPPISEAMPVPAAEPKMGPSFVILNATGSTTGAMAFTTFLMPLKKSLTAPNSGWPVTGLIELSSSPTI